MSGIYICRSDYNNNNFIDKMVNIAVYLESDVKVSVNTNSISCLIIHHGRLNSCGINLLNSDKYVFAMYGACWLDDDSNQLASPDEALRYILKYGLKDHVTFKGNYNYILYNKTTNEIIIESDLFGVYPLYYMTDKRNNVFIASEVKALAQFSSKELNLKAVAEYLKYGYIVTDLTLISGIYKLSPNSRITIDNNGIKISNLSYPEFSRNTKLNNFIIDDINVAFVNNINRYKSCTANSMSISLSGGLDSRIAAFAANSADFKLYASCSGVPASLECKIAKIISDQLGADFICYTQNGDKLHCWIEQAVWITEGRCHPGHMHFLESVITGYYRPEVQLHGLIGDAVIGGDFDLKMIPSNASAIKNNCVNSMLSYIYWPSSILNYLVNEELKNEIVNTDERILNHIFEKIKYTGEYNNYLWFRFNFRVFGFTIPCLVSQIFPWTDPILPYLDNKFIQIVSKLDLNDILDRKAQIKWALKHYSHLADVPRLKDGVLINMKKYNKNEYENKIKLLNLNNMLKYYICRISRGNINIKSTETYPYYDQWYRRWNDLRGYIDVTLLSSKAINRGLWDANRIKGLLHDLRIGKNVWNAIGSILTIELFIKQFIENDVSCPNILNESIFKDF